MASDTPEPKRQTATILVVDDNPAIVRACVRHGQARGYRMVVAEDGVSALELYRTAHPDLILLDISLPRLDGRDVYARLQKTGELGNTIVVFQTDREDQLDRLAGLEMGAADFISKPYDVVILFNRVQRLLEKRAAGVL